MEPNALFMQTPLNISFLIRSLIHNDDQKINESYVIIFDSTSKLYMNSNKNKPIMKNDKNNKKTKKSWMQYGVFAVVAITLYATGLHTEVIGFAQRGLLATGLMNPNVKDIAEVRHNTDEDAEITNLTKADFNLKLMDRDGHVIALEELKGKVIFMNFWATWCPPCIAEMPSIDKLHKDMGDEVAFVMLSFDQDFETAKAYDKRKAYDLPIYTLASPMPALYNSTALPTTYVIDAKGNLALTHKGMGVGMAVAVADAAVALAAAAPKLRARAPGMAAGTAAGTAGTAGTRA